MIALGSRQLSSTFRLRACLANADALAHIEMHRVVLLLVSFACFMPIDLTSER